MPWGLLLFLIVQSSGGVRLPRSKHNPPRQTPLPPSMTRAIQSTHYRSMSTGGAVTRQHAVRRASGRMSRGEIRDLPTGEERNAAIARAKAGAERAKWLGDSSDLLQVILDRLSNAAAVQNRLTPRLQVAEEAFARSDNMLEPYVVLSAADDGIADDYPGYRSDIAICFVPSSRNTWCIVTRAAIASPAGPAGPTTSAVRALSSHQERRLQHTVTTGRSSGRNVPSDYV